MKILGFEKTTASLAFITIANIIGSIAGAYFPVYPQWVKVVYGLCIYLSLLYIPYKTYLNKWHELSRMCKFLIFSLLVVSILSTLRGIYAKQIFDGNKYFTLFFNPIFVPMLYTFLFVLYGNMKSIMFLKKVVILNVVVIFIMIFFHSLDLRLILICCCLFPIYNNKNKFIILLFIALCVYCNFTNSDLIGGGQRKLLVIILYALISYILIYVIRKKFILSIFIALNVLILFTFVRSTFSLNSKSIFEQGTTFVSRHNINNIVSENDTRTFLYNEFIQDINQNNAWLFGKGAYSFYRSDFFGAIDTKAYKRNGIEVTILQYILRSGLIYVAFISLLIFVAVYQGLYRSNSKYLKYISLNLVGYYLNLFMGDFTGFDLTCVAFWILAGLCLNKYFLSLNDNDIILKLKDR